MNQKKKARRARGLGSDSGLDLAISRFTNSLGVDHPSFLALQYFLLTISPCPATYKQANGALSIITDGLAIIFFINIVAANS